MRRICFVLGQKVVLFIPSRPNSRCCMKPSYFLSVTTSSWCSERLSQIPTAAGEPLSGYAERLMFVVGNLPSPTYPAASNVLP